MSSNAPVHLNMDPMRKPLRLVVFLALSLAAAPAIQSQTPSDAFFFDPAHPDQRGFGYNIGTSFAPKNQKPAASIVAKGVVLRGWLVGDANGAVSLNPKLTNQNLDACTAPEQKNCGTFLGFEDVHYELVLDYDFISSTYGQNGGILNGATLHGNPIDSQTPLISLADPGNRTVSGIGINSFWLPYGNMLPATIGIELNAWHARGSQQCEAYNVPGVGNVGCDLHENYAARGPAPAGWVEREFNYTSWLPSIAADNWWPFDPEDPDGLQKKLQAGDYVEIQGTLWQDLAHDAPDFWTRLRNRLFGSALPPPPCWGQAFHNQDGYLEIHPVDSMKRVPRPEWPSPAALWTRDSNGNWVPTPSRTSAQAGVKTVAAATLCADASDQSSSSYAQTICPGNNNGSISDFTVGHLVPQVLELIDERFSTKESISHSHPVNSANPECVDVQASSTGGTVARYKASYVVSWKLAPIITNPPEDNVVGLGHTARFAVTAQGSVPLTYQWKKNGRAIKGATSSTFVTPPVTISDLGAPFAVAVNNPVGSDISSAATITGLLSVKVCPTLDGQSCTAWGPTGRPTGAPVTDLVTVTSGVTAVAGVTVSVSGQPTVTATTKANGIATITHLACFAPGGEVPKVGQTTVPVRQPVPCDAMLTKDKFQPLSFRIP